MSILKHAIDAYNVVLNFSEKLSRAARSPMAGAVAVGFAFVVLIGVQSATEHGLISGSANQTNISQGAEQAQQQAAPEEESLSDADSQQLADNSDPATNESGSDVQSQEGTTDGSAAQSAGDDNVARNSDFSTEITSNKQITAGVLIAYDSTTNTRTYYGGDVIFSATTVTISKSDNELESEAISVQIPDGKQSSYPVVVHTSDTEAKPFKLSAENESDHVAGKSFVIKVAADKDSKPGVYTLHLMSLRSGSDPTVYEYHGFLTVRITQ